MIVRELVTRLRYSNDDRGFNRAERQLDGLHSMALRLGAALAAAFSVQGIIRLSDEWKSAEDQIRLTTRAVDEQAEAIKGVYDIARASRQEYSATANLYSSISRNSEELGLSLEQRLALTETIARAMRIGGGDAAGQQAALTQLGQALGSGVLRGEELNSILEQAPRLAQAIAEAFDVSVGKLRDMGAEGELSAEKLARGLIPQLDDMREEFEGISLTFADIGVVARNTFGRLQSDIDKATGITRRFITSAIDGVRWLERQFRRLFDAAVNGFRWLEDRMGGTEEAIRTIQLALLAMAGPAVIGAMRSLARWVWASLLPFMLISAAIFAVLLGLEDIYAWSQGNSSLIGDLLGPFNEFSEPFRDLGQNIAEMVSSLGAFAEELGIIEPLLTGFGELADAIFGGIGNVIKTVAENTRDLISAINALINLEFGEAADLTGGIVKRTAGLFGDGLQWMAAPLLPDRSGDIAGAYRGGNTSTNVYLEQNGFQFTTASGSPSQNESAVGRGVKDAARSLNVLGMGYSMPNSERLP